MTTSILFVCLGNICRSPSAEGVVRAKASARGMDLRLDSAGTGDWHVGKPPYPPMIAAAASRGYDLTDLRARQVSRADFDRFDLIVAMDDENLSDLRALRPGSGGAALIGFTDVVAGDHPGHVPDPYFTRDFDGALDLVERAADGLLDRIAAGEGFGA
ncbi:Low molecular weight protein-tyrosine-phosphatase YfkJ [Roseivivax sp. THAF40]|uniref:low molecular weight protein-tyrosine-phosphatase n=1 Tax=unclassified Roseivivax TaxID=2639302 RepID=UPI0012687526|nr:MULTISPECIES: low molecular weight protein-tyrosine-phosphatase [unclassified Roseivivax]QFS81779.1 Low molecular weight protein-tyrosine-phosphatase YfkJ [Roseivivax sp. THAF197b]QFT45579.1 Low molecular weight protein-tyrosine-phosphatase YfkJ [Roseivivax sp. THAF40]